MNTRKRPRKIYIGIRLEEPLLQALRLAAKRKGVSVAEEIRNQLRGGAQ